MKLKGFKQESKEEACIFYEISPAQQPRTLMEPVSPTRHALVKLLVWLGYYAEGGKETDEGLPPHRGGRALLRWSALLPSVQNPLLRTQARPNLTPFQRGDAMASLSFQRPPPGHRKMGIYTIIIWVAPPFYHDPPLSGAFRTLTSSAMAPAHTHVSLLSTPIALIVRATQSVLCALFSGCCVFIHPFNCPELSADESYFGRWLKMCCFMYPNLKKKI